MSGCEGLLKPEYSDWYPTLVAGVWRKGVTPISVERAIAVMTRSFADFFRAIDLLIENQLDQPALVLIYSTIDAAASLDREPTHKEVESRFSAFSRSWVADIKIASVDPFPRVP